MATYQSVGWFFEFHICGRQQTITFFRWRCQISLFSCWVINLLQKNFPSISFMKAKAVFLSNVLSVSICGCSYVYFNKSYFCNNTWSKVKTYGNVNHCNGESHNYLITSNLTHEDLHQLLSKLRRKQFFIMGLNYWDMVWLSPQWLIQIQNLDVLGLKQCIIQSGNMNIISKFTNHIHFLGLPNDLHVFWQQYPWVLGESLCKIRALISEM